MTSMKPERQMGPDLVRILACFTVLSVHFFLNNGFYSQPVIGKRMFIMVLMRSAFMVCVPLFLLLTGYLMRNKKLEKGYYAKGVKTLVIYLLASIACIIYKKTGKPLETILGILSYSAAPYAWYIEMYFGLFLMIPFLNTLYHALPSREAKKQLLATFLFLTAVPQLVNSFRFTELSWWMHPSENGTYQRLLPQWWRNLYPITYYFIGAYIGEYQIRLPCWINRILVLAALLFSGVFNYWRSYGNKFIWGAWTEWGSLLHLIPAVLLFILLISKDYSMWPRACKKIAAMVSELSLGIYLVSYIFDNSFYKVLENHVPIMTDRLPWFFVIVPAVFLSSLLLSAELELIWRIGNRGAGKIAAKIRESREQQT